MVSMRNSKKAVQSRKTVQVFGSLNDEVSMSDVQSRQGAMVVK
jgi:hypothetical protein